MSPVNYAAMSYQELRRYFLTHREDDAAFQAYLARRRERSRPIITTVNDPDFESKIQAAIHQQMAEHQTALDALQEDLSKAQGESTKNSTGLQDERDRQASLRASRDANTSMLRELESVISLRPKKTVAPRITSI